MRDQESSTTTIHQSFIAVHVPQQDVTLKRLQILLITHMVNLFLVVRQTFY